jgi:hypothetical protein
MDLPHLVSYLPICSRKYIAVADDCLDASFSVGYNMQVRTEITTFDWESGLHIGARTHPFLER